MPTKGYLLPENVNPGVYRCIKVFYPDDPAYRRAVLGAISYLQSWFAWDRDDALTGKEAAAEFRIAYGMTQDAILKGEGCDDGPVPAPPEIITIVQTLGGGPAVEDDELMPCIDITNLLKIEGGKLYGRDSCCEWKEIGTLEAQQESIPDDFGGPDATYSACGKATAIVDAIYLVAGGMFDASGGSPFFYVSTTQAAYPAVDLKDKYVIEGVLNCAAAKLLPDPLGEEELLDEFAKATIICKLVNSLSSTAADLTADDYAAINAAFNQNVSLIETGIFGAAANALGKAALNNIAKAGALDLTADCDCPRIGIDDPTIGWTNSWKYFFDFSGYTDPTSKGWTLGAGGSQWVPGQGIVDYADESTRYSKSSAHFTFVDENATVERIRFYYKVGAGFAYDAGDALKVSTDQDNILTIADVAGGNPSSGGEYILDKVVSISILSADNKLSLTLEGHVPAPVVANDARSPFLVAIALGGSGNDPFS